MRHAGWQWSLAWRFLHSGNVLYRSFSLFCLLGVAAVVMGFIWTYTILSGFDAAYLRALVAFNGSAVLFKEGGLEKTDAAFADIAAFNRQGFDIAAVPFYYTETMVLGVTGASEAVHGVQIKALESADWQRALRAYHVVPRNSEEMPGVYLGKRLDHKLGSPSVIRLLRLSSQSESPSLTFDPHLFREFPVAGYFETGLSEFDETFMLMAASQFATLTGTSDSFHGIEFFSDDSSVIPDRHIAALRAHFDYPYTFIDWRELNQVFFQALKTEKTVFLLIAAAVMGVVLLVSRFFPIMLPAELYFLDRLPVELSGIPIVLSGVVLGIASAAAVSLALRLGRVLQGTYRLH